MSEGYNPLDDLSPERKVRQKLERTVRDKRIAELTVAYRNLLESGSSAAAVVMEDLSEFCHYGGTTYRENKDPREMMICEGRRQVYLRMKAYMEGAVK